MGHGNYVNRNLFIIEITFKQLKNQYALYRINLPKYYSETATKTFLLYYS